MPIDPDTAIGGAARGFPATRLSAIEALRSDDSEARSRGLETLVAHYWKPAYKYLRIRWRLGNEDAKDLTQGFFTRALEHDTFAAFDAQRGAFRTFLRTCLDRYAANEHKAARRLKRGGAMTSLDLDFEGAEAELRKSCGDDGGSPDETFHREWVRAFFGIVVDELRERLEGAGKARHFELFERYDLGETDERPTYAELGQELGLKVTDVTNHLAAARREMRRIVLEKLAEVTVSDAELRREARALLGIAAP